MRALLTKNVCENKRIGSHWGHGPIGGHGPPMQALFTENVCENERIGSRMGGCTGHAPLDPPMSLMCHYLYFSLNSLISKTIPKNASVIPIHPLYGPLRFSFESLFS